MLSRHPTVIDGRLVPRHVDLRPFVSPAARTPWCCRAASRAWRSTRASLVVNSSQNGGAKDTWVLRVSGDR